MDTHPLKKLTPKKLKLFEMNIGNKLNFVHEL